MSGQRNRQGRWALVIGLGLLALLGVLIAGSPRMLIYDERYYMEASWFLVTRFDFLALMTTPLDVAPGPVYAYLHYFLSPLTGLLPPAIRFVNWACLAGVMAANAATIRRMGYGDSLARAAMVLAVPMIWTTSGLALTELPALLFASLAVLATAHAVGAAPARAWWLFVVAGIAAGLALMARQTCLPGLAGFVLLGLGQRRLLAPCLLAVAIALLIFSPLLITWHGLAPPWMDNKSGISVAHGIMAFVYLATAALLIAPGYFLSALSTRRHRIAALVAVAAVVLVVAVSGFRIELLSQAVARLPAALQGPAQLAGTLVMVGIACAMAMATLIHLWDGRGNRRLLLLCVLTMMLTGSAAGITWQFSSRYVVAAFPFALLMLQPWLVMNRWAAARLLLGALLGCISLTAYYRGATPFTEKDYGHAPPEVREQMRLNLAGLPGS